MPQNRVRVLGHHLRTGDDAVDGHRADHQRHHRVGRDAEREQRNERGLRAGIVGGLRPCHAFDRALAEARRILGQLLLQRVGRKRREHRAIARQDAEHGSEPGRPHDRSERAAQIRSDGSSRPMWPLTTLRDSGFSRLRRISAMPNTPMASTAKSMPSDRSINPESEAILAGLEVGADRGEQQSEHDHDDGFEHRAARQHDRKPEAEHHQPEIFGGPEQQREPGQRRADGRDDERGDRAREERRDRRDAERDSGLAFSRHLRARRAPSRPRSPRPGY